MFGEQMTTSRWAITLLATIAAVSPIAQVALAAPRDSRQEVGANASGVKGKSSRRVGETAGAARRAKRKSVHEPARDGKFYRLYVGEIRSHKGTHPREAMLVYLNDNPIAAVGKSPLIKFQDWIKHGRNIVAIKNRGGRSIALEMTSQTGEYPSRKYPKNLRPVPLARRGKAGAFEFQFQANPAVPMPHFEELNPSMKKRYESQILPILERFATDLRRHRGKRASKILMEGAAMRDRAELRGHGSKQPPLSIEVFRSHWLTAGPLRRPLRYLFGKRSVAVFGHRDNKQKTKWSSPLFRYSFRKVKLQIGPLIFVRMHHHWLVWSVWQR